MAEPNSNNTINNDAIKAPVVKGLKISIIVAV
jgi:hypothetical protein